MIQTIIQNFYLKRRLIFLLAVSLLAVLLVPSLNTPSSALTSFGDDCLPCHQSGMIVSTNATDAIQVDINDSFWLEVSASGGIPRDTEVVWSNISHNIYFSFIPNGVSDNSLRDLDSAGGQITALFEISAPNVEGDFTIRTFAASSQGRGGFIDVEVVVGAGGEIPRAPLEVIMELIKTFAPTALISIAMLGIVLYTVGWYKIPEGAS